MATATIGRPPRFKTDARFKGKDEGPADFRGRIGTVVIQGPGAGEYTVRFDDSPAVVTCVQSIWIEPL
jgi:hypothetical protein